MQAENQSLFDDPNEYGRLKAFASGHSNGRIRGGMSFIEEDKIRVGEVIYRVGHSNKTADENISSPWWMRDSLLYYIMNSAEAAGTNEQQLYRMKCAVSYDFGVADILLQVRVKKTLRAFTGRGRPVIDQAPGKAGLTWFGAFEIAQLFIPGLRDFKRNVPTPLCLDCFELTETFNVIDFIRIQWSRTEATREKLLASG
jgi:hypothetical protein